MKSIGRKIIIGIGLSVEDNLIFLYERRNGGIIYFDTKKREFIRFGFKKEIKKEFEIQKNFLDFNFKVANITFFKEIDKYFLYSEKSLGENSIGIDIKLNNISYEKGFNYLYDVLKDFLISKKNTINKNGNINDLQNNLNINKFKKEFLEINPLKSSFINKLFNKIFEDIEKKGIYSLTHGDFNSRNIFKEGFIDVEDSYNGLLGYDLISFITHGYWFEVKGKRSISFSFEVSDIKKCLNLYNKVLSQKIENNFGLLFLLRGIWACSGMDKYPEEQIYRFHRFEIYAKKYIKGESILEYFFQEVENINIFLKSLDN